MAEKRDRSQHGLRDMVMSLTALLLIIGALLFFNRGCSFSPGTPETDSAIAPTVDARADLTRYASSVDFPIRVPSLPAPWRANSSSSGPVAPASVVVRVGWLTPGRFVQLSQSGAPAADVVSVETGQKDSKPTGSVEAGGRSWQVFPGRRDEKAWATEVDGATLVITGSGSEDDFRTMATAVLAATPVTRP
ncbi:hypothetical protein [Alloactinosynnema sp. L-07]|uniref:DUF4245 domain-containing protein n=1 Tax=Alloactinosynnema sp. L-07 TaxID=1653480 RepID=UPI00065F030F|nr:DUF4245 domain-containing protein [Alloactinosynnema sp. L-07]CRK61614.1 hypothetical protein [Alloactinosynnema sp. L-07]